MKIKGKCQPPSLHFLMAILLFKYTVTADYICENSTDLINVTTIVRDDHILRFEIRLNVTIDGVEIWSPTCGGRTEMNIYPPLPENSKIATVPNDIETVDINQMCEYRFRFYPNDTCFQTFYTVPECVDEQCCNIYDPPMRIVSVEPYLHRENYYNISIIRTRNFTFVDTVITYFYRQVNTTEYLTDTDMLEETRFMEHDYQLVKFNFTPNKMYEIRLNYEENYTCWARTTFLYKAPRKQSVLIICLIVALILLLWIICCSIKFYKTIFDCLKKILFDRQTDEATIDLQQGRSLLPDFKYLQNPNYLSNDPFEIDKNYIHIKNEIGEGSFGQVCYGTLKKPGNTIYSVAIKKLKSSEESQFVSFKNEIKLMKKIGYHENLVQFMGCCTRTEPFYIVMEFVPGSNLKKYLDDLRKIWMLKQQELQKNGYFFSESLVPVAPVHQSVDVHHDTDYISLPSNNPSPGIASLRPLLDFKPRIRQRNESISTEFSASTAATYVLNETPKMFQQLELNEIDLQNFAVQIGRGMEYLEGIKITHRDLAARNVLITPEKKLKISDFGMSKLGDYMARDGAVIPIKWTSIEGLISGKFTTKSDVWSYGVVLWEIGSLGKEPYEMNVEIGSFRDLLQKGMRLAKPEICTDQLYELMKRCWSHEPDDRPSFKDIMMEIDCKKNIYDIPVFVRDGQNEKK